MNGRRVISVYDASGELDYKGMYDFDRWMRLGYWNIKRYYIANDPYDWSEDASLLCNIFYLDIE